ncbi:Heavy metal translocating P-type ATPase [Sulfidibacter corallicola]|uniref:P-type Zn(2+) transporter n=1 Tax=Sulfidibacter corallicola TaxID=2818388 RepID=A0A8A4TK67_SULCO|nr:heavy metal translocating P-type ATPase [Sulfidibacter corallicola]QTD49532.1 heavy metal translocating P-type ATPase [Sulfidibacter corallicola]
MLFSVGAVFATYAGVRLFEERKKVREEKLRERRAFAREFHARCRARAAKVVPSPPEEPETDQPVEAPQSLRVDPQKELARLEHYTNMSIATMGIFGLRLLVPALGPVGMVSYIYTAMPYMRDVEKSLVKDRKANVDVLFFLADMLTLGSGSYFTAGFGLWLIHSAKSGAQKAKDNSDKMIADVFEQLPQKVWLLVDGSEIEVPFKQIRPGDTVVVATGQVIPVDGIVTEGLAAIDQRALTGESQPAEKTVGDRVFANTAVITGRVLIMVEKSGEDTTASRISQLLVSSVGYKSDIQLKGEKWADLATQPMLIAAGVMLPVVGAVTTAVFINSHFGNRIRLLAPMATLRHITVAAQHGMLVKDGRALEKLCHVDTVLFDKTGTLTSDEPEVLRIFTCPGYEEQGILRYAAMAEGKVSHPIARAILKAAMDAHLSWPDLEDSQYKVGYGITVELEEGVLRVGSIRFMTGSGIGIPQAIDAAIGHAHSVGNTMIMVAMDREVIGAIELQPSVRPDTSELIRHLRELGIRHMAIVSGDHGGPTRKLAEELGMDEYFHDILPEQKADIVTNLQAKGRSVCFIGDGINDAIAMREADVSISLAGANTIATDVAEIIMMDGDLAGLGDLFYISHKLDQTLHRSLELTIAPGVLNLGGAFVFHYGIMASLLVNFGFGGLALADVLKPFKLPDRAEMAKSIASGARGQRRKKMGITRVANAADSVTNEDEDGDSRSSESAAPVTTPIVQPAS